MISSKMQGMFDRIVLPTVQAAARSFPVVVIVGARQVGKTTLARVAFPRFAYRDLEDPRTAERWTSTAISTES